MPFVLMPFCLMPFVLMPFCLMPFVLMPFCLMPFVLIKVFHKLDGGFSETEYFW